MFGFVFDRVFEGCKRGLYRDTFKGIYIKAVWLANRDQKFASLIWLHSGGVERKRRSDEPANRRNLMPVRFRPPFAAQSQSEQQ